MHWIPRICSFTAWRTSNFGIVCIPLRVFLGPCVDCLLRRLFTSFPVSVFESTSSCFTCPLIGSQKISALHLSFLDVLKRAYPCPCFPSILLMYNAPPCIYVLFLRLILCVCIFLMSSEWFFAFRFDKTERHRRVTSSSISVTSVEHSCSWVCHCISYFESFRNTPFDNYPFHLHQIPCQLHKVPCQLQLMAFAPHKVPFSERMYSLTRRRDGIRYRAQQATPVFIR